MGFINLHASLELVIVFSFFSTPPWPRSVKVTRISQLVLSKMTSLLPYLVKKYFPPLLLFQPSSDFPHRHHRHAFISTFPESWAGGRKALSSPSSLIEIKVWPLIPTVLARFQPEGSAAHPNPAPHYEPKSRLPRGFPFSSVSRPSMQLSDLLPPGWHCRGLSSTQV